jgi:hypothetical protein
MDAKWKAIARYINPDMTWEEDPGAAQKPEETAHVYDTTAIRASNLLADGIQGYSFARNQAWFRAALEGAEAATDQENAWLQFAERRMYAQLQRSNFYDEARMLVKYGADFGTAIMTREDDVYRGMPAYKTQHLKHCVVDENAFGEADALFRDFWADAYKAAEIFGEEGLPGPVREAYGSGKMKRFKFTQAIVPAGKYDLDIERGGYRQYYSVFWADIEKDKPLRDGYYALKPFFVWRWSRNLDGGVWGADSPGMMELPDIRQANSARASYSRIVQQMGSPPIKATEGLAGRIRVNPAGITYMRGGEDFTPVPVAGNPAGIADDIERLRKSINDSYYVDFFLILSQNIERQKTATEVAGIQGEKAALMSSFYGRLSYEFLEPALEDVFSLEIQSGRIPRPPDSLLMKAGEIRLDMVSPLAQAQQRYLMLGSSQQALSEILALAQAKPSVLDNLDLDQQARNIAAAYNLDKRVVIDIMDVERMRQARAEQQAAAQQAAMRMQALEQGSKAIANVSKAPPEMLEQVQAAMGA